MKKILYILLAIAAITGCGPKPTPVPPVEEDTLAKKIAGEWHCTVSDMDADIFLGFAEDGSFELYQKIGEGSHRLYRGTWKVADESLGYITGKYNDGSAWGSDYAVTISDDRNHMTMVPRNSAVQIEYVYSRQSIPEEIKSGSVIVVKSEDDADKPVL